MGGAIVALGQRRALARLPLARGRPAARNAAVERAGLDLLLDERDRGSDSLAHGPGHLGLCGDREVAANVLEKGAIRLGEVLGISGESLHRALACGEHLATVLELRFLVHVGINKVLDRPVNGSRVLIHATLNFEGLLVHVQYPVRVVNSLQIVVKQPLIGTGGKHRRLSYRPEFAVTNSGLRLPAERTRTLSRMALYPVLRRLTPPAAARV